MKKFTIIHTIFILVLLGLLWTGRTFGQENRWVLYFVDEDDGYCYYDTETLQRNVNGSATVWIKVEYLKPIYVKAEKKYKTKIVSRYLVECAERKMGLFDLIVYFDDGTHESFNDKYTVTEIVFPETMGEALVKELCP